jgi:hypothetical protein
MNERGAGARRQDTELQNPVESRIQDETDTINGRYIKIPGQARPKKRALRDTLCVPFTFATFVLGVLVFSRVA